jgi:hypothetical protein
VRLYRQTDRRWLGDIDHASVADARDHLNGRSIVGVEIVGGRPGGPNNDRLRLVLDDGSALRVDSYPTGIMHVTLEDEAVSRSQDPAPSLEEVVPVDRSRLDDLTDRWTIYVCPICGWMDTSQCDRGPDNPRFCLFATRGLSRDGVVLHPYTDSPDWDPEVEYQPVEVVRLVDSVAPEPSAADRIVGAVRSRWRIHICEDCGGMAHYQDRCPKDRRRVWTKVVEMPVVPCDDEAVERVAQAMRTQNLHLSLETCRERAIDLFNAAAGARP